MATAINPVSWLTARRVRVHGLLLAVCLWTVYAADMTTPGLRDRNGLIKGTDFLHFYTLGTIALQGRGDLLYDIRAQSVLLQNIVPEAAGSVYVPLYGPQVSLLFAPFARLPYGWALTAWLAMNVVIYSLCCYRVWKKCSNLHNAGWTVPVLAIAFPGFFYLLAWGQTSGLALLCFTLGFLALRRGRSFLAGLAIGSLIFKPQLLLAAAIVFVFAREWNVMAGTITAALAQFAVGWWHYGTPVVRGHLNALTHVGDVLPWVEPRPYQMHSLRAFWFLLVSWPYVALVLYAATAAAVVAVSVRCWKSNAPLAIRFSTLLLATVLVTPHLTVYDLVILAPAFLSLGDWAAGHTGQRFTPAVQLFLYLCYPLFLMGSLTQVTHLQLSVVAMTGLLWTSWQVSHAYKASCSPQAITTTLSP